jgi:hypothetical protein
MAPVMSATIKANDVHKVVNCKKDGDLPAVLAFYSTGMNK